MRERGGTGGEGCSQTNWFHLIQDTIHHSQNQVGQTGEGQKEPVLWNIMEYHLPKGGKIKLFSYFYLR